MFYNMHNMHIVNMQNNMQNDMQNMHAICSFFMPSCLVLTVICKICRIICLIWKICEYDFQNAEYASPTLLMSGTVTARAAAAAAPGPGARRCCQADSSAGLRGRPGPAPSLPLLLSSSLWLLQASSWLEPSSWKAPSRPAWLGGHWHRRAVRVRTGMPNLNLIPVCHQHWNWGPKNLD